MSQNRRDRRRGSPDRESRLDPKPVILLVCEGRATEPLYFRGLANLHRTSRVDIEIAPEQGVPRTLVMAAKQYKRQSDANVANNNDDGCTYDSIWCIFDVDDHPHIPDALQMARDNGIELAISNPCFELWLLLHFRDQPGMQHRDTIRRLLKEHDPAYDKSVDFGIYSAHHRAAASRAKRMDQEAIQDGEPGRNPSTAVYRIATLIAEEASPGPT